MKSLGISNLLTFCFDDPAGVVEEKLSDLIAFWVKMGFFAKASWREEGRALQGS